MRIDKVEIDGFGKLNNCSYTFSDGLNLIYGKNESGKSTLCEFILAMFYGLPNESKREGTEMSARKKYRPFDTESFGGRIYFTDNDGKKMVLERSFKATKRSDKAVLRDGNTWEETGDVDNIGEKCFGVTREAFLKTLYVKSFGADNLKSDDGEIMSRLSNLETSGDEDVSYSSIVNAMEKEIYSLKSKTGKGGKIAAIDEKQVLLSNERSASAMVYSSLESDEKTAGELKLTATKKEAEAKALQEQYNVALNYEKYLSQKKINETGEVIKNRIKSEKEKYEALKQQAEKIENEKTTNISAESISRARALETKLLLAEEKEKEIKDKNLKKPQGKTLMIILLVVGVLMFGAGFFVKYLYALGLLSALSGVILYGVWQSKYKKTENRHNEEIIKASEDVQGIKNELSELLKPYGVSVSDELSAMFATGQSKEQQKEAINAQLIECEKEIQNLENSLPENKEDIVFSEEVINYSGESAEKLFEKINFLESESRQMSERANEILMRIAKETAEVRKEDEIITEINEFEAEKQQLLKRYNALLKAYEWISLAHDEIKNNFAPRLNERASQMLSYMTDKKYQDLRANDSFGINLKAQTGEIYEAGYMSRGTYDLMYIALRFAAMSVLSDGHIPPVILDDAFSQLDDGRLADAVGLINESQEFSQVLLFTCHQNYKEMLKDCTITELS